MNKLKWAIPVLFLGLIFSSCKKEEFLTDASVMLDFSQDTVLFDTVFTTVGSTTELFKIYNRENRPINVSSIYLAGGSSSQFRMNVDGIGGTSFENIEIPAEDSLFIFVEVTVDPNGINSPLIVTDSILFQTNGNLQDVDLVAWGQDAYFFFGNQPFENFPSIVCLDDSGDCFNGAGPVNVTWENDKPYVIYGYLFLDEGDFLQINPGCQIHFHESSGLWVFPGGQIQAIGTAEEPIVFQGDRLEDDFDDIPGQWDRIWVNENPNGNPNTFEHCIIKNNFLGIQAEPLILEEEDLLEPGANNTLRLNKCVVKNNSGASLLLRNYNVEAENCLFANAGQFNAAITGEGTYTFNHCTFGNFWSFGTRSDPAFFASNSYQDVLGNIQVRSLDLCRVTNSVIYGNSFDEIGYFLDDATENELIFDAVLFKVDELDFSDPDIFMNVVVNQNPQFVSPSDGDFHLESMTSPLIDRPLSTLPGVISPITDIENTDITGNFRDWGAYEFVE
ncbi:MAG: hypothetical protein AAF487_12280 [Bacteroidota bacterium]